MKQEDVFYEAMKARDHRFDGKFFIGVKTTGVYCRPICPARPKRENIEFFLSMQEAEAAGYRPCMRCRPEAAPRSPAWIGKSAIVQRAVKILNSMEIFEFDENEFAERFGVSARHLRRLFKAEIGKTPKQLSFEIRLNLARKLISETNLSMSDIAFAAGFNSIRRFNSAFKDRFKKSPKETKRLKTPLSSTLALELSYRPPFDFVGLIKSYEAHRVGNLEWFENEKMFRIISFAGTNGIISVSNNVENSSLRLEIDFPDTSFIHVIINRIRNMFDLDSDPVIVANALEQDVKIKKLLKKYQGIRIPSGWDAFEVAIGTILGQRRSLLFDLIEIAGSESDIVIDGKNVKLFPTPGQIIKADLSALKTATIRKEALKLFAAAIMNGGISLESTQEVDKFVRKVMAIKGIGLLTAQYMGLKALRDTDAFPASDLILKRAVESYSDESIELLRPWRGYFAALLWRNHVEELKKEKNSVLTTI